MASYIFLNDNKDKVNGFSPTISYDRPIELAERSDEEEAHHHEPKATCHVVQKDDAHQHASLKRDIPYIAVYDPPEIYERRGCFIPAEPIKATIVSVERDPSETLHLFNPYLYTLEVEHGPYKWSIERRFKDFQHLHNRLVLYRTGQKMSAPLKRFTQRNKEDKIANVLHYDGDDGLQSDSKSDPKPRYIPEFDEEPQPYQAPLADAMAYKPPRHKENVVPEIAVLKRRNTWPAEINQPDGEIIESQSAETSPERKMPKMPLLPDSFLNPDDIETRRGILQAYINGILKMPSLRKHKETEEFLEVSHLSFIHSLGEKEKEGIVKKKPGGQHQVFIKRITTQCSECCRKWDSRWLLIKDSFIAYLYPFTNIVREVMLIDSDFEATISSRQDEDGVSRGVKIKNYSRDLLVKAKSDRIAAQWKSRIDAVLNSTGKIWKEVHQFGSFYPVRQQSCARWFVDGRTFLEHAADMLDSAREEIFITGWWLTPELFMKRPAPIGSQWQLMNILKRKAEQGVHVFCMIFKEIEMAMMVGSYHAKQVLMDLHPNILVFRHPDPVPVPSVWTHHEKMVVVDQKIAFIGGMDLSFGRWDDYRHQLTDLGVEPPLNPNSEADTPVSSDSIRMIDEDDFTSNGAENGKSAPSPRGPDGVILRHGETHHIPTFEDVNRKFEEIVNSGKLKERNLKQSTPPMSRKKTAMRKKFDEWKEKHFAGDEEEEDPLIKEYEEMVAYLQNEDTRGKLWIGKDYANYLYKDICDIEHPYIDYIDRKVMPRTPWHDLSSVVYGCSARDAARHFVQRWNQIKSEKFNYVDKYPYLVPKAYDEIVIPEALCKESIPCTTQVIRSGALWSCGINCKNESIHQAYIHLITNAEHFVYIENQFFVSLINSSEVNNLICKTLFDRICKAHRQKQKFRVIIFLPLLPAFAGELGTNGGMNMQAVLYWTYKSISKGPNSLFGNLEKEMIQPEDYIGVYGLRSHAELSGNLVSEVVYIHSKAMIVDDRFAIIGSANLNDRSFMGDRDSEVCCYYEDTEFFDSTMDGKPYKSGRFAGTFRRQLLHEHLGLLDDLGHPDPEAKIDLSDLVSDEVISYIKTTARNNTDIYDKVFKVYPTDLVRTWAELTKLKADKPSCMALTDRPQANDLLSEIEGYIVEFPLKFLFSEDLSPPIYAYQKFGQFAVV